MPLEDFLFWTEKLSEQLRAEREALEASLDQGESR